MAITLNGKAASPPRNTPAQAAMPEDTGNTDNDVLIFLHLVSRSLEARRELSGAVAAKRRTEARLNDPDRRAAAERNIDRRIEAEKLATIDLMEINAALARQWDGISPQDKHRYALTTLIGEPDPDMGCIQALWCTDRGLGLLVPFPDNWAVPYPISYRVFDTSTGVKRYTIEEVLNADYATF